MFDGNYTRMVNRMDKGWYYMAQRGAANKKKKLPAGRAMVVVFVLIAVIALIYNLYGESTPQTPLETLPFPAEGEIRVSFLDIGQGDSILIQSSEHNVLIDTGEYSARRRLLAYLRESGVERVDYLIATHPHEDHIGGMNPVLNLFDVRNVVMPDVTHNTRVFENLLNNIDNKKIPLTIASAGDVIKAGIIELVVVSPEVGASHGNINDMSLVLRLVHGDTAFLFTGDVEQYVEDIILSVGRDIRANVLKVSHHGSNTSTSGPFLDAVAPAVAVISVGSGNPYGHPNPDTIGRLSEPNRGILILRTDLNGSIVMTTDGVQIELYARDNGNGE